MSKLCESESLVDPEAVSRTRVRPTRAASDRKRKQALALFEKGFGYRSVANALGLSEYTVRDWSRQYKKGKFVPKLSRHLYLYSVEARRLVIDLRKAGWTWKQIAERTGVNSSTARIWVRESERQKSPAPVVENCAKEDRRTNGKTDEDL